MDPFERLYVGINGYEALRNLRIKLIRDAEGINLLEMGFKSSAGEWLLELTDYNPGLATFNTSDLYTVVHSADKLREFSQRLQPEMSCRTGGVLNTVNHKHNTHLARVTISVNKLIEYHRPNTADELEQLIKNHIGDAGKECDCGCPAHGNGIPTWGDNLYKAVQKELKDARSDIDKDSLKDVTMEECVKFMHDLYTVGSMQGTLWEKKCIVDIGKSFPDATVRRSKEREDMDFAFDVHMTNESGGGKICGIQVKPVTYCGRIRKYPNVHQSNLDKNERWDHKVFYLYYDAAADDWSNYRETIVDIAAEMDLPVPIRRKRRFFELGRVAVSAT